MDLCLINIGAFSRIILGYSIDFSCPFLLPFPPEEASALISQYALHGHFPELTESEANRSQEELLHDGKSCKRKDEADDPLPGRQAPGLVDPCDDEDGIDKQDKRCDHARCIRFLQLVDPDPGHMDHAFEESKTQRDQHKECDLLKSKRNKQHKQKIDCNGQMHSRFAFLDFYPNSAEKQVIETAGDSGFLPLVKDV